MISSDARPVHEIEPTGREIPLPISDRTRKAILRGRQSVVVRRRAYGVPGDYLVLGSIDRQRTWVVVSVTKVALEFVAYTLHQAAGADSPEEFIKAWKAENDDQWEPRRAVHVHCLEEVMS